MKSKLTIILLIFLLYSCSLFRTSTKEVSIKNDIKAETDVSKKTEEKTELKKDSSVSAETKFDGKTNQQESENIGVDWSEDFTLYDTTKPVNPITGKPPILSERRRNYKSDKQKNRSASKNILVDKKQSTNLKVDLSKQLKAKSDITAKLSDKSKSDTTNKEESTNWKMWYGLGFASLIAVRLAIRFGKKLILPRFT